MKSGTSGIVRPMSTENTTFFPGEGMISVEKFVRKNEIFEKNRRFYEILEF